MKEKLSNPRAALRWADRLGFCGLAVMAVDCVASEALSKALFWVLIAAGVLMLAGAVVVEHVFCRCPHCGSRLGWCRRRPFSLRFPEHCPRCGGKL